MRNYLILGGSGFIGKSLTDRLSANNYVRILSNIPMCNEKNVEVIIDDFAEIKDFSKLLEDIDVVFHLISTTIPTNGTHRVYEEITNNVLPTLRLLEELKFRKNTSLIFISSGGTVYGELTKPADENDELKPICTYGMQKLEIENFLKFYNREYGFKYRIARVSNPYGIGQSIQKSQGVIPIFIRKILNNETIEIWGDGGNVRDYIYMDDLIDALILLSKYEGNEITFNIGSGKGYSLNEVINIISKSLNQEAHIKYLEKRDCDLKYNVLDISKVHRILGFSPKTELKKGVERMLKNINS